jgi:uncharacterized protein (TIGR03067 family)
MTRNATTLSVAALLVAGFVSPDSRGDAPESTFSNELKAMAGTWTPIFLENNGFKASKQDLQGIQWLRNADGTWTMQRDNKTVVWWAVKTIDATKKPKTIDIEITAGEYKGVVYQGIYELDGDTLRICFALPDRTGRPTEFSAHQGSICALSVFKRQKD